MFDIYKDFQKDVKALYLICVKDLKEYSNFFAQRYGLGEWLASKFIVCRCDQLRSNTVKVVGLSCATMET